MLHRQLALHISSDVSGGRHYRVAEPDGTLVLESSQDEVIQQFLRNHHCSFDVGAVTSGSYQIEISKEPQYEKPWMGLTEAQLAYAVDDLKDGTNIRGD